MSFQSFLPFTPSEENNFQLTTTELITQVMAELGIGTFGEGVQSEYYQIALTQLNLVVMEMISQGLHLNTYKTGYLFLTPNQAEYVIQDEHSTNTYFQNQLTVDAVAGDTVLTFAATTNVTAGDYYGVTLDDGSFQWTTVVSKTSTTVTITDALTGDATTGNYCINYTSPIRTIKRIHQMWRRNNYVNDIPLSLISRQEYDALPYKSSSVAVGIPSLGYYSRSLPNGTLFLWPPAQDSTTIISFWYESIAGQMMSPTDIIDFDPTYMPAVIKWCAYRLCNTFNASNDRYQRVKMEAQELMEKALSFDDEQTPVKISLYRES